MLENNFKSIIGMINLSTYRLSELLEEECIRI